MRFYTQQQHASYGIDLHTRSMDVWLLNQDGAIRLHRILQQGGQGVPSPLDDLGV